MKKAAPLLMISVKPRSSSLSKPFQDDVVGRQAWSDLSKPQVTSVGVQLIRQRFASAGFSVATASERTPTRLVVQRYGGFVLAVRVATCRPPGGNYVFFTKKTLALADDAFVALVLLQDRCAPDLFLIPTVAWRDPTPLLVDREYEGMQSEPEWGISVTGKSRPLLEPFMFGRQIRRLVEN